MSASRTAEIERIYDAMQGQFQVNLGSAELADSTQFYTNRDRPVHRWFQFKEGFAADLFTASRIDTTCLADETAVFLDPFCGTGTSLLAGDLQYGWHGQRIGLEINPLLWFVAETKTRWRDYDPTRLNKLSSEVLAEPLQRQISRDKWPALSTFRNPAIFAPRRISALLDAIGRIHPMAEPERDLLLLGVAAAAERLGFYRKDGRALRILRSQNQLRQRRNLKVESVLRSIWAMYESDLRTLQALRHRSIGRCGIFCADGRTIDLPPQLEVDLGTVTLIAYSPPYLNHIDYTEVYKVELWLLGFVTSQQEMLELRKQTLRSHASTSFAANGISLPPNIRTVVEVVASEVAASGTPWHRRFQDTAFGYLEDMRQSLSRQYELLRPGAQALCVVANSAHGSGNLRIPIATDLLLASVAENIGFEVQNLLVARQMRRRDHLNRYLRETVLILRRPVAV